MINPLGLLMSQNAGSLGVNPCGAANPCSDVQPYPNPCSSNPCAGIQPSEPAPEQNPVGLDGEDVPASSNPTFNQPSYVNSPSYPMGRLIMPSGYPPTNRSNNPLWTPPNIGIPESTIPVTGNQIDCFTIPTVSALPAKPTAIPAAYNSGAIQENYTVLRAMTRRCVNPSTGQTAWIPEMLDTPNGPVNIALV